MVNVIKVCKGPLRSTSSPAPPAAHGTKTVKLMSLTSLTCFVALAGTVKSASAANRNIIIVIFFFTGSFREPKGKVILADNPHQTRARTLAIRTTSTLSGGASHRQENFSHMTPRFLQIKTAPEQDYFAMQIFLGSVKNRSASSPPSRPTPLCFIPPKGTRRSRTSQQFTQTVPV
jgi:hypothetical protein